MGGHEEEAKGVAYTRGGVWLGSIIALRTYSKQLHGTGWRIKEDFPR